MSSQTDITSHCHTHQHDSQIDSNVCLKEERFEVVCHVADDDHEDGGNIDSEDGTQQTTAEENLEKILLF